jgi:transcriptional antiterminator RfaH
VPDGIVEDIRAREDERGIVRLPKPPPLDKGQRVRLGLSDGEFDGLSGLVEDSSNEQRITVLLNLLGREIRVRVAPEMVRAVA